MDENPEPTTDLESKTVDELKELADKNDVDLESKTVDELKELADKNDVDVDLTGAKKKAEIIDAIESETKEPSNDPATAPVTLAGGTANDVPPLSGFTGDMPEVTLP